MRAALDYGIFKADLFEELFVISKPHNNTDAPGNGAGIGDDSVSRGGDIVTTGSGHRTHRNDNRLAICQPFDFDIYLLRWADTTAGRIDP